MDIRQKYSFLPPSFVGGYFSFLGVLLRFKVNNELNSTMFCPVFSVPVNVITILHFVFDDKMMAGFAA